MDRFSGDFIIFELQRELLHKKEAQQPTIEPTQQTFDKLWLDLKDLTLVNLIMERSRYGFNPDWDVCRIKNKPLSLKIHIADDKEREIVKLETKPILYDVHIEVDAFVKDWADENVIRAYAIAKGKTKITLEDLPGLAKFR